MVGSDSVFHPERVFDHIDPAHEPRQAALLSQFPCAAGAEDLAGLPAGVGGGLSERPVVHRPHGLGRREDRTLAGLFFLCPESVSPESASGDRPLLGAGHRGTVLLLLGTPGTHPAPPLDAGSRPHRDAGWIAAYARHALRLAYANAYPHSSGRNRVGQPAGAGGAHASLEAPRVAGP